MPRGVKKENLPTKVCVTCDRPFTWRKKWEKCWDEVSTCSKSCNAKRKKAKQKLSHVDEEQSLDPQDQNVDPEEKIKEANAVRTKECSLCQEEVLEAFRVRYDESKKWKFVCRKCWPRASGRTSSKEAGSGEANPLYQYGGTWKSVIGHKMQ